MQNSLNRVSMRMTLQIAFGNVFSSPKLALCTGAAAHLTCAAVPRLFWGRRIYPSRATGA